MSVFLYLAVLSLFILLAGYGLFAEGMFLDGVTYATISRNLANGIGSFWSPHYTETLCPQFDGHPPLAIGLESLAFRILGDHPFVERLYSLATILITGYIIVLIWRQLTGERKSGWIPLLFWIAFPLVSWATSANLLDNTMGIFTALSVWFILIWHSGKSTLYLILAGTSIAAGFLCKGPFALFPLILPFLLQFSRRTSPCPLLTSFLPLFLTSLLPLLLSSLLPLVLLSSFWPEARESLHVYWQRQVVASLSGTGTVSSRVYIIGQLIVQLILPVILAGSAFLFFRRRQKVSRETLRRAIILFCLGLAGSLPVMVSLKQSNFYLLASLPCFALSLALLVRGVAEEELARWHGIRHRLLLPAGILLLSLSITAGIWLGGRNPRNRELAGAVREITALIPPQTVVRIHPDLYTDWQLHAWLARKAGISLDPSANRPAEYYLTRDNLSPAAPVSDYTLCLLRDRGFVLFRK